MTLFWPDSILISILFPRLARHDMTTQKGFDPHAFRAALGTFTTGVTIITTRAADGEMVGITANSFNSVSLNPPMVLWSLAKNARSLATFSSAKHWNVHVLSVDQEDLSGRFARQGEDKFAGLELDDLAGLLAIHQGRFSAQSVLAGALAGL